jgi:hypothetical protein
MKEEDRESWVGKNRLYLSDDNILYVTVLGEIDEETSTKMKESSDKFAAMVEGKLNLLVDLNKAGMPSPGARNKGQKAFEGERIDKVAFFGLHPVARVIASFVIGTTKKNKLQFFKSREEALVWLRGDK